MEADSISRRQQNMSTPASEVLGCGASPATQETTVARLVAGLSLHGGPERPSCEAVTGWSVRSNPGGRSARAGECLPGKTP